MGKSSGKRRYAKATRNPISVRPGMRFIPRTAGALAQTEMKYFDSSIASTAVAASTDWTGTELDPTTLNTLFAPVQGNDIVNRIGREVMISKIKIRGFARCTSQATQAQFDAPTLVRLLLVQDKQTNAAQMQGEDVMAATGGTADRVSIAFQNTSNFGRFRVWKDKIFVFTPPAGVNDAAVTTVSQAGLIKPFKFALKFRGGLRVRYNVTNGGTVADCVDNSFHVIATCTSNGMAPNICYDCRVVFADA